ncbi:hypothetical protein FB451DRAFT_1521162 [Mycena latifolia]|nr:hypothetical protein FB451DRAFT_1521162 [Mycena latifolia]
MSLRQVYMLWVAFNLDTSREKAQVAVLDQILADQADTATPSPLDFDIHMAQEPSLPLELEREIFEAVAHADKSAIPTLLRVCHRVHTWLEPLLYRVLAIRADSDDVFSRVESVLNSRPAGFLQNAVRHVFLWIKPERRIREQSLLWHCSGITNLWIAGEFDPEFLPALNRMRLEKLALDLPFPSSLRLDHPLFLSVTHLDLWTEGPVESWDCYSSLASLPVLTHLRFTEPIASIWLPRVIAECPQVFVIHIVVDEVEDISDVFAEILLTITDQRVVVTELPDYTGDWMAGARGGDNMWARAETFLAHKRSGEIPRTFTRLSRRHMLLIDPPKNNRNDSFASLRYPSSNQTLTV